MSLPMHDWQFWVVTIAAALIIMWALRAMTRRRKTGPKRATLTVHGHKVK